PLEVGANPLRLQPCNQSAASSSHLASVPDSEAAGCGPPRLTWHPCPTRRRRAVVLLVSLGIRARLGGGGLWSPSSHLASVPDSEAAGCGPPRLTWHPCPTRRRRAVVPLVSLGIRARLGGGGLWSPSSHLASVPDSE